MEQDLEILFLDGFITDGPKKGENKHNPEQALAILKNMKLPNGRRKYSNVKDNPCGPLPTKLYIQGKFSRQKEKMAKEEREKARISGNITMDQSVTGVVVDEENGDENLDEDCFDEIELLQRIKLKYNHESSLIIKDLVKK